MCTLVAFVLLTLTANQTICVTMTWLANSQHQLLLWLAQLASFFFVFFYFSLCLFFTIFWFLKCNIIDGKSTTSLRIQSSNAERGQVCCSFFFCFHFSFLFIQLNQINHFYFILFFSLPLLPKKLAILLQSFSFRLPALDWTRKTFSAKAIRTCWSASLVKMVRMCLCTKVK